MQQCGSSHIMVDCCTNECGSIQEFIRTVDDDGNTGLNVAFVALLRFLSFTMSTLYEERV